MIDLLLCVLLLATSVSAFVQTGSRLSTAGVAKPLYENFGFDFAEDGQGAQPGQLLGEVRAFPLIFVLFFEFLTHSCFFTSFFFF